MASSDSERERALAAWGIVRSQFHFVAREVRGRSVELIAADDRFDGAGLLASAGARSVRLSQPEDLHPAEQDPSDVVVSLYPSSTAPGLRELQARVKPDGVLFTRAGGDSFDLPPNAAFFRQIPPAGYSHRERDLEIRPVGLLMWMRFLIADAFSRLFLNRGVIPGEYDFRFAGVSGATGAAVVRVPGSGEA